MNMIITLMYQIHEQRILWLYRKSIQYIYYLFIKDNCCLDSITLWYVNTTLRVCMYMIRSALSLYQWGKEPISTNTCQNRNTCLYQRHILPIPYRLVFVHKNKELPQQQYNIYTGIINTLTD